VPEPILIAPEGELDIARVGDFRLELSDAAREAPDGIVVDLSEVSFIDSAGLGATAAALLVNLTGLKDHLPLFESREAALDA
jgi:anti-anti-sigma factor